ncbi:hypothetical protein STSP2_02589 [Anaerohalosphaera lusitana]|uniref:Uncharacterized protein n=1 Tax=Anaerohalosphaera lusitana TaxID=1936003 RepID=A0A1U9NP66_9BACT|nr:hypothetical protein [Anaerohalosphaera lusitana]AQT69400.1 hypothetical protein STSP2_02589 [Anaerohalosphaera lusitana]
MKSLSKEEKDIILDFYFRCGSQERIDRARDLIASDKRAAELFSKLQETLDPLGHVREEPCPDELAEITVARLKLAASAERTREQVEIEQTEPAAVGSAGRRWWSNITDVAAVAAIVLAVISLGIPSLNRIRQASWEKACQANLAGVGVGLKSYAQDSNGSAPCFGNAAGQNPWWKIGEQTERKNSNTQPVWVLVKKGYVDPENLICPARKEHEPVDVSKQQMAELVDFPARKNLSYSFAFMCEKGAQKALRKQFVLFGDLNPIFESVLQKDPRSGQYIFREVVLNDDLQRAMSRSHGGRGQNLLFGDISVSFNRDRKVNGDDIYTVQGVTDYSGTEVPKSADDIFLAP